MGASRKLQGEIDRVLKKVQEGVDVFDSIWNKVYDTDNANQKEKFEADLKKEIKKLQRYRDQIKTWIQSSEIKDKKVSASYEQALMDARKLIEREMERFKICEKETKTKAFSKEGLGQQPKTDPKEKAKSETRDWLNNTVSELESQIDSFEAEMEGLSVKKGKAKPPRLTHLESSITRHKAHIMKLELILRLLDNDELSPEQVNDVKEFIDDYVERNQEDFDEFEDVDMLYNTLSLDMVDALEDLVSIVPPGLVKGVGSTSAVLSIKNAVSSPSVQSPVATVPDQVDATLRHDELGQETLLNLLLRNYLHYNLYDQAEKLRSKAPRFEAHSNQQFCRYLFYLGKIRTIQLEYTDAKESLLQAARKAPVAALGFRVQCNKWAVIVRLLLGEIPERTVFMQKGMEKALRPYFELTNAVRIGDLELFKTVAEKFSTTFSSDRTNNLIVRLRHNVIRTGLRNISISYSRISLSDVAKKLRLDSPNPVADAESIVSKAIRDGAIDATLDHANGWMVSKETGDIYSTNEPQQAFNSRIAFCLNMHNEAVRALRFPPNSHKEKESAEKRRERQQQEQELAKHIAEEDEDDF